MRVWILFKPSVLVRLFHTPSAVGGVLPLLFSVEVGGTQVSHLVCSSIRGGGVPGWSRVEGWLRLPTGHTATPAGEHVALPYSFLRGVPCHQVRVALLLLGDAERSDSPLGSSDATAAGRWMVVLSYWAQVDVQAPLRGLQ